MKHTLDDVPELVKSAWNAVIENDLKEFLSGDPVDVADDMLGADAFIEELVSTYGDDAVRPLVLAEVRKLQNDM